MGDLVTFEKEIVGGKAKLKGILGRRNSAYLIQPTLQRTLVVALNNRLSIAKNDYLENLRLISEVDGCEASSRARGVIENFCNKLKGLGTNVDEDDPTSMLELERTLSGNLPIQAREELRAWASQGNPRMYSVVVLQQPQVHSFFARHRLNGFLELAEPRFAKYDNPLLDLAGFYWL